MIKSELRSLVKNLLPRFNEIEVAHPRVIDAAIEKGLNEFYNLIFLRNPHELQRYTFQIGYTVPLAVSYEATTHLYYTDYPTAYHPIVIPDKCSGIRRISTPVQGGIQFHPMDSRELDLVMHGAYVQNVTDVIGYVTGRTRVEYYNIPASVIASGVRLDALIPFSEYADTDIVLTPELTGDQGTGLVERILQLLSQVKPVELNENKQMQEGK
jgi:hypothetical protein